MNYQKNPFFLHLTYPLTAGVVGAPRTTLQHVSSIFFLHCPVVLSELQACPVPDLVSPPSLLSAMSPSLFDLEDVFFCRNWWTGDISVPIQFTSLSDDQEVFVWSGCLLDLGIDFLVGNMVFVWDALHIAVAPHFHGSHSSLQLCCEGPWFTSIQEIGCDKVTKWYLETGRNASIVSNWFRPCQCCCRLC